MLNIQRNPNGFGVRVEGLDLARPIDDATRARLHELWIDNGLIHFPAIGTSPEALITLSRCFGGLEIHPTRANLTEGFPEVIDIVYKPTKNPAELTQPVYEIDGTQIAAWLPWHSDLVYMDRINHGGILRSLKNPTARGKTGFIDCIAAYETLPDALKARIDNLEVAYQLNGNMEKQKFLPLKCRQVFQSATSVGLRERIRQGQFPAVAHPMVFTQPETGRKVLNVSPVFALGIVGMPNPEGDALLREVVAHLLNPQFTYFHQWHVDDMVLFDNWRLLHCAEGMAVDASRHMQRTTIEGDYAQGRKLTVAEASQFTIIYESEMAVA